MREPERAAGSRRAIHLKSLLALLDRGDKLVLDVSGDPALSGHYTLHFGPKSGIMDLHRKYRDERCDVLWVGCREEVFALLEDEAFAACLTTEILRLARPVMLNDLVRRGLRLFDLAVIDAERLLRMAKKRPLEDVAAELAVEAPHIPILARELRTELTEPIKRTYTVYPMQKRRRDRPVGELLQIPTSEGVALLYLSRAQVARRASRLLADLRPLFARMDRPEIRQAHEVFLHNHSRQRGRTTTA